MVGTNEHTQCVMRLVYRKVSKVLNNLGNYPLFIGKVVNLGFESKATFKPDSLLS